MNIIRDEKEIGKNACIALGMFDGVHKAHAEILTACADYARENGYESYAYTYENLPVSKQDEAQMLTTLEEKLELIAQTGIQNCIVLEFTKRYANSKPDAFIRRITKGKRVKAIFCGYDYRFGKDASGDVALLKDMAEKQGYELFTHEAVEVGGEPVSSTRIRAALQAGDISLAVEMLGRPVQASIFDYSRKHIDDTGYLYGVITDHLQVSNGTYEGSIVMGKGEAPCELYVYKQSVRVKMPWQYVTPEKEDHVIRFAKRLDA